MSTVTDGEIRELLDRQKCYDVLTRYCRALDRADVELMKTVYWDDAVDDHGVFDGNAQDFAEFIISEIQNWFEVTMHTICNVHMEYYGDAMCTESYLLAYHKVKNSAEKIKAIQVFPCWTPAISRAPTRYSCLVAAISTGSKNVLVSGVLPPARFAWTGMKTGREMPFLMRACSASSSVWAVGVLMIPYTRISPDTPCRRVLHSAFGYPLSGEGVC